MREVKAVSGGKVIIKDNVEEIYEKKVTPYGNGAKIDAQKRTLVKESLLLF